MRVLLRFCQYSVDNRSGERGVRSPTDADDVDFVPSYFFDEQKALKTIRDKTILTLRCKLVVHAAEVAINIA